MQDLLDANTFIYAIAFFLSFPAFYLGILTCAGAILWLSRKFAIRARPTLRPLAPGTIAFVIPAHNEQEVIARTIQSLKAIKDTDFSINVVADNCTDDTAKISRSEGAQVYERFDTVKKSKGHALAWLIPQVIFAETKRGGIPPLAIVVIDADATISPDSATFARQRFASGQRVLQSAYILEPGQSSRSKVMTIAFSAINVVRGYGRAAFRVSDTFKGNGMWFQTSVLESHPWQAFSLAEDLEFGLMLRGAHLKIEFFGESTVTGMHGEGDQASSNQRARWEGGRLALVLKELPKAIKSLLRSPSLAEFDLIMELATPPLTFYVILLLAFIMVSIFIGTAVLIPIVALLCLTLHLSAAIPLGGHSWRSVWDLAGIPLFFLWKILLLPRIWRDRASKVWIRTQR